MALKVRLSGREVSNEGKIDGYEIIVEDSPDRTSLRMDGVNKQAEDPLTGLANYPAAGGNI